MHLPHMHGARRGGPVMPLVIAHPGERDDCQRHPWMAMWLAVATLLCVLFVLGLLAKARMDNERMEIAQSTYEVNQ